MRRRFRKHRIALIALAVYHFAFFFPTLFMQRVPSPNDVFFAYLWLREERLGKRGAAVGAILFAASGPLAVRWFWQATNATTLYPALLWIALRAARGRRTPLWAVGLTVLAYALAGFPAT